MILSRLAGILLLLGASPIPAATARAQVADRPDEGGDILVRARKLRDWRAVLVVGRGDTITCRIVRTTGDAALDTRACTAQQQCYETQRPNILAAARRSATARRRALAAVGRALDDCFDRVSGQIAAYPLADQSSAPARRR